ncbi:carotenoid oxygenase family protein, partial [Cyanobium sp. HWJ4-Hawea]|uniref:carotenoid oxygenase family protein n=1 Tax=Cyanobium sp. HWJ4-Hawea TaxID=2823713 RepID=UPI0020CC7978
MTSSLAGQASVASNRDDWARAFRNVTEELDGVGLQPVRGTIPPELNGTLYRNGPGRLERAGLSVHHPFDGDGMITAFRFAEGS